MATGPSAAWEFVYRSPKLHVLLGHLDYTSPRGNAHLQGRIVLIVHSGFYREVNGEPWVQHDVEAYVKVDSKGWKAVARTVRPVIERLLEDQVREAGWFVSLMGRLVPMYPNWACQVVIQRPDLNPEVRQRFRDLVTQTRRPGASSGRPVVVDNSTANPDATLRRQTLRQAGIPTQRKARHPSGTHVPGCRPPRIPPGSGTPAFPRRMQNPGDVAESGRRLIDARETGRLLGFDTPHA